MAHFYSRASREARLFRSAYRIWLHYFYSRASREARLIPTILSFSQNNISTHAPLARRDLNVMWEVEHEDYFYSRASREARPKASNAAAMQTDFYSRSLARRDEIRGYSLTLLRFLLTRLSRGATWSRVKLTSNRIQISTHAPLARRDGYQEAWADYRYISTHAPLARRDFSIIPLLNSGVISTHAPLARRDLQHFNY